MTVCFLAFYFFTSVNLENEKTYRCVENQVCVLFFFHFLKHILFLIYYSLLCLSNSICNIELDSFYYGKEVKILGLSYISIPKEKKYRLVLNIFFYI